MQKLIDYPYKTKYFSKYVFKIFSGIAYVVACIAISDCNNNDLIFCSSDIRNLIAPLTNSLHPF